MKIDPRALGKPTISDIARLAGVSTATVSRALAHPDRVQIATRERVMAAVQQTGYTVNSVARNLRTQRTNAILVLTPNLANPFFSLILSAITKVAATNGFGVLIADTAPQGDRDAEVMRLSGDGRADGIILLDSAQDPLSITRTGLPMVLACEWIEGSTLPKVAIDNIAGAKLAVEHLASLGHTKIAHVTGPAGNVLSKTRAQGWAEALRTLGLTPGHCYTGDFTMKSGVEAAKTWIDTPQAQRPTAVFCASDECALGFIGEIHRASLRVPTDVSVVGFDDIEIAGHFIPALTTIHQPRQRLGARAAEMVIRMIRGQSPDPGDATPLPVNLVKRDSTAQL